MQTGGEALENYAGRRASEAVRALEAAAPSIAHRVRDGIVEDIPVDQVRIGDELLLRPGELVPCDAVVVDGRSHVDTSTLTGEPVPVTAEPGVALMSGSVNEEGSLTLRATAVAAESRYARIVELVRSAQASKAPLQRLADRYAVWFTPLVILVCIATYLATHDASRVLAVLVVATPCPLILATPVAIVGGINRAARRQIIIRNGTALERLGTVNVAAFDKTGTITIGLPDVSRIIPTSGFSEHEILRLAAAVEQGSSHLLARTLVEAAEARGVALPAAVHVVEAPGRGVQGEVEGQQITVGSRSLVLEHNPQAADGIAALEEPGEGLRAYMAVDGRAAAIIEYADHVRPGMHDMLDELRRLGIPRFLMLSGDRAPHAEAIARDVGLTEVRAELLPEEKAGIIAKLVAEGNSVLMVGDGTNDAPALSSATVGIALAGHGGGITAEAADVVLLVDDLSRVPEAVRISQRTVRIARESIGVGLGLSGIAMVFAAGGFIAPALGALLQEAIDVAVILNALRASRPGRG
jgi:heavy metal translocating P-type ATPase